MVRHESEQRVSRSGALGQFPPRPGQARAIGPHLAKGRKAREHLVMHPIADDDARPIAFHFNLLRSRAPMPSTTITHIRMVRRIAET